MKIVGKQGNTYMVVVGKEELLQIVFGSVSPTYTDSIKKDVYDFIDRIEKEEVEVFASKVFINMMRLSETDLQKGYSSVLANLDAIRGLVTPIQKFASTIKEKSEKDVEKK
jgi:hypothetical protein